jgi:hypothetical protein
MTSSSQSSKARSVESLAHLHTVFIPLSPIVREGGMSPANEDHLTITRAEQVHRRAPELGWPSLQSRGT